MKKYGLPDPEFYEERDAFRVVFRNSSGLQSGQVGEQVGGQQIKITELQRKVLDYCVEPKSAKEIKNYLQIKSRQYISTNLINPLIKMELLDYVNKNSIKAPNQKYISK